MTSNQRIWAISRDHLAAAVASLGYPEEFADLLAKQLGSPKGIDRLTSYLYQAKPGAWREKKESQEAQASYNSWLNSDARR